MVGVAYIYIYIEKHIQRATKSSGETSEHHSVELKKKSHVLTVSQMLTANNAVLCASGHVFHRQKSYYRAYDVVGAAYLYS